MWMANNSRQGRLDTLWGLYPGRRSLKHADSKQESRRAQQAHIGTLQGWAVVDWKAEQILRAHGHPGGGRELQAAR